MPSSILPYDSVRAASDEALSKGVRRLGRQVHFLYLAMAACLGAAMWFDWRFLPTALVLALFWFPKSATYRISLDELQRRLREAAVKPDPTAGMEMVRQAIEEGSDSYSEFPQHPLATIEPDILRCARLEVLSAAEWGDVHPAMVIANR